MEILSDCNGDFIFSCMNVTFKNYCMYPGGLLSKAGGSNMQNPTALSFLLVILARYLSDNNQNVNCGNDVIAPSSRLIELAKSQVFIFS